MGHFCLPDSESGSTDLIESGSTDLIESGSNPDPQHWFLYLFSFYELWSGFVFRRLTGKKLMAAKHLELQGWQVSGNLNLHFHGTNFRDFLRALILFSQNIKSLRFKNFPIHKIRHDHIIWIAHGQGCDPGLHRMESLDTDPHSECGSGSLCSNLLQIFLQRSL